MGGLKRRNPDEPEFHQAVFEVAESVIPFLQDQPQYLEARILERMTEPDRAILFRVAWVDDSGEIRANKGYRVQFNNAIGPYKGGLRFHPTVTLSVLKFLGFEQTFKNSLTTLPMGGAKGGSDFNPHGRSDDEVLRFCQSFMTQLYRYIGSDVDVPAGDIGVGGREISYLFGQYKRITHHFNGVITGKGPSFGGSLIRTEATGYGCVYFMKNVLEHHGEGLEGKTCLVSGAGNVAQYTAEKLADEGAKVVTMSDSDGFVHDPEGIAGERLEWIKELKNKRRGRISEYADEFGCNYYEGEAPWRVPCDLAFPSATQNELSEDDARTLIDNGVRAVGEGANMPTEQGGVRAFREAGVLFAPSKAANAGGVAVSGLEQTQNAMRLTWTRDEVDRRLREIMGKIHGTCVEHGERSDKTPEGVVDYVAGANIGGFIKVADAMLAYGVV
ncbi:MAG: NADP-specific glutamate dehydrogenase [Acidobacteria bacterium]|nr:MAG: NADP-specific glutamate dehydrogenase [Acidobacteriota bacterium]REK11549.1 MAG: NADP-specific glutamate dehydrogenase [Acidobacteriota bacterium]